jgi:signal transduction histidine kinase
LQDCARAKIPARADDLQPASLDMGATEPHPRRVRDRFLVLLVGAFATVSVGFLGATALSEARATAIDRQIESVEGNSLPSVEHLETARAALRHLDVGAMQYAGALASERSEAHDVIDKARAALLREIEAENATPDYPGERELRVEGASRADAIGRGLARLFDPTTTDSVAVYGALHRNVDALDDVLARLSEINASEAHAEVAAVSAARRQSLLFAVGVDAGCVLLSVAAVLLTMRAVRRQRELERAHARALVDRANELDMFAKRVAHDLLNPLSALSFTLSSIRRNSERHEPITSQLARADSCLRRARQLVDGALDFARSGVPILGRARAPLREAVAGVVAESDRGEDGEAELVVESIDDAVLACAPGVLSSILSNLVGNALKFTKGREGRRVAIRARAAAERGRVRVEVEDNGPGLPPGLESRVFDAYERAPDSGQPGLGLGLATVRRFVDAHGGRVGVESASGRGCVFWFELPLAEGDAALAMA